jgi:signal transduction histidine kinase
MAVTQRITDQNAQAPSANTGVGFVPDGGLLLDSSGRVVAISAGAVRLLGRTIASLSESLEGTDAFPAGRVVEALLRANDVWAQTSQMVTLERPHRRYVLVRTELVRQGPEAGLMLAVVTDLTEILRQSDLLGDFVRQIRHDLRGPLTSLRGAVDLLLSERVGSLEERQKKLLDLMDREAQQMADMISAAPAESERDASDKT